MGSQTACWQQKWKVRGDRPVRAEAATASPRTPVAGAEDKGGQVPGTARDWRSLRSRAASAPGNSPLPAAPPPPAAGPGPGTALGPGCLESSLSFPSSVLTRREKDGVRQLPQKDMERARVAPEPMEQWPGGRGYTQLGWGLPAHGYGTLPIALTGKRQKVIHVADILSIFSSSCKLANIRKT